MNGYPFSSPSLGGPVAFTDISTPTSVVAFDTAGTTVSGGNKVAAFEFGKAVDNFVLDLSSFTVEQPPGTLIVFAVVIDGGTSDVDVGLIWRELF